jgi:hypothetical protein
MNLTLGVHGPKFVHAILFDDTPPDDDDERIRPSDFFDETEDNADFDEAVFDEDAFEDEAAEGAFDDEDSG